MMWQKAMLRLPSFPMLIEKVDAGRAMDKQITSDSISA
jgi:hypothetical protein